MQIASSILVIVSVVSCTSPEYVFVEPESLTIPTVEEFVDADTLKFVHMDPPVVEEPQTVNDLLTNIAAYRDAYLISRTYWDALEDYIDAVRIAVNEYGVEYEL